MTPWFCVFVYTIFSLAMGWPKDYRYGGSLAMIEMTLTTYLLTVQLSNQY